MPLRRLLPLLAAFAIGFADAAQVHNRLEAWRVEAGHVRQLLNNDVPLAKAEILRLQDALPADAAPADRVRLLNLLARAEAYLAETEIAARHLEEAHELARRHDDKTGQVEANLTVMLNAVSEGRLDKMREASAETLLLLDGMDRRPELLAEAMQRTTMLYFRHNQLAAALALALQNEDIARRSGDPLAQTYAQQGLAIAYDQSGAYEKSLDHYRQMLEFARAAHSRNHEAFALNGIAQMTAHKGDAQAAEKLSREAIELIRATGMPFALHHFRFGLATILRAQGRLGDAVAMFDTVVAGYRRNPSKIGLWWSLNTRAGDLLALGRLDAAERDAAEAQALGREVDFPLYIAESGKRLAAIAAARGDYRSAHAHRAEADAMAKKAEQLKASEIALATAERFQTEVRQREIDALKRKETENELKLKQLWTVLIASLASLAITAYSAQRLRRSRAEIRALNIDLERRIEERTDDLRQQTRYLRTLIDTLPVRVWMKDAEGRYLTVNNPEAKIGGHDVAEMIGKTDRELWPGAVGEARRAADLAVMETRRPASGEIVWSDGEHQVWMEIDKAPVIDENNGLLGTVGVARDVSERRTAEKMREAALADARRLARLRGDFLAQMSHELRTPLNGILGHAQMMERDPALSERQRQSLGVIRASGGHLTTLIDDILDFARIEARKLELAPDNLPLGEFLRLVTEIVAVKARQKNIEFSSILSPDLPAQVSVDGKRLRQVLLNLLSNAVKFTERGQIGLRADAPAPERLRFEVRDTGIGIPEDKLETIFHPFEQAGDVKQRRGGTGLGLAISRQLVRLMGGEITVESRVGEGSRFLFEIDVQQPAPADTVQEGWRAGLGIPLEAPSHLVAATNATLPAPPPEAMAELHRLALIGNMRDIVQQAARIDALDPIYHPFAAQLKELAESYQSKALLAFVERHHHASDA